MTVAGMRSKIEKRTAPRILGIFIAALLCRV
jgi:hypothetical protein